MILPLFSNFEEFLIELQINNFDWVSKDEEDDDISGGNRLQDDISHPQFFGGKMKRRRKREAEEEIHTGLHFVYKRKDHAKHSGDYGELYISIYTLSICVVNFYLSAAYMYVYIYLYPNFYLVCI